MNFVWRPVKLLVLRPNHLRYCTNFKDIEKDKLEIHEDQVREFFSSFFGLTRSKTDEFINDNPSLKCKTRFSLSDIKESAEFLLKEDFTRSEIKKSPQCLLVNKLTLTNRKMVLQECAFKEPLKLIFYHHFVLVLNKKLKILKAFDYIDERTDIVERLQSYLDIPVSFKRGTNFNDQRLSDVREQLMSEYLKKRLEISDQDLGKLKDVYNTRLKHKSFQTVVQNIQIMEDVVKMSKERLVNNAFVLHAEPDNVRDIIERVPTIGGVPIVELIEKRPKFIMQNCDSIIRIIKDITSVGIDERGLLKCLEILTLGPDTVYQRISELSNVKEFEVLRTNPRILRLIHYQVKAKTRLDYLKLLKLNCASLHVLSSSSETFEKYARDGIDRNKGTDVVCFLSTTFNKDKEELREKLMKNLHWYHVSSLKVKSSIDYLHYMRFTDEEILQNILICLYPLSKVEAKLKLLSDWRNDNSQVHGATFDDSLTNSQILALCMYFIELEFHFSGDGIWEVTKPDVRIDFSQSAPELPSDLIKDYRFGKKPKATTISV